MLRTSFRWPPSPCISRTHTLVSMFHRRSAESCAPHQPSRQGSNESWSITARTQSLPSVSAPDLGSFCLCAVWHGVSVRCGQQSG